MGGREVLGGSLSLCLCEIAKANDLSSRWRLCRKRQVKCACKSRYNDKRCF